MKTMTKHVHFTISGREMVVVTIPRHRRLLNAPRPQVKADTELGMKPMRLGY